MTNPAFPFPIQPKALAVPSDDGLGFHNAQGGAPIGPNSREPDPNESVAKSQSQATVLVHALQQKKLMTECQVWIHRAFVKSGRTVYRCSLEQNHEARLFEIPQWMFESGACCRLHSAEKLVVDCAALLDLKLLLHRARSPARDLVLQAQHQSAPGGADARIGESTEDSANPIV
jgi:hypothetical protein